MEVCERSWGKWEVLDRGPMFKLKRLTIESGQSISLQYHNYRTEIWTIVQGQGMVTLGDDIQSVQAGDSFVVHVGMKHRVSCVSEVALVAIEVQVGEICEESDIVRIEE